MRKKVGSRDLLCPTIGVFLACAIAAGGMGHQFGKASWYNHVGGLTASGARLDTTSATAAHRLLPLKSHAKVTNLDNHRSVIVKINDRGPYIRGRIIDLSPRAADVLKMKHTGVVPVIVEPLLATNPGVLLATSYFPPAMFYVMADISHWDELADPVANFAQARAYGITKVGLKATQGDSYIDPTFAKYRSAAMVAGVGVCAYSFLDATLPASAQADYLLKTVGSLDGIELAIDVETNPAGVSATTSIALAADVAQAIANAVGFLPIYYGTRWGPDNQGGGLPNAKLSQCPLWLAEWGNTPICPVGWDKWLLWQSTDGQSGREPIPVPGLGVVDRSYIAASSLADIDTWWGKRT